MVQARRFMDQERDTTPMTNLVFMGMVSHQGAGACDGPRGEVAGRGQASGEPWCGAMMMDNKQGNDLCRCKA